jgi:REP element-mobilizing transposase RayT
MNSEHDKKPASGGRKSPVSGSREDGVGNSGLTPAARHTELNSGLTPAARHTELNSGLTPAARQAPAAGQMDRYWLLTWTTYGTWLPGDDRGFVSNIDRGDGKGYRLNQPGTEPAKAMRGLTRMAAQSMKGPPVYLDLDHATVLFQQLQNTANYRGWQLQAIAIMRNHVHVVVGVPGDPEPDTLLRDFKSYGSRAFNQRWKKPSSGTWWTESGSKRKLPNEDAVAGAVAYVRDQEYPLAVWIDPRWQAELGPRRDLASESASGGRQSPVSERAAGAGSEEKQRADAAEEKQRADAAEEKQRADAAEEKQRADARRSPLARRSLGGG